MSGAGSWGDFALLLRFGPVLPGPLAEGVLPVLFDWLAAVLPPALPVPLVLLSSPLVPPAAVGWLFPGWTFDNSFLSLPPYRHPLQVF